jgi:hypothetical protein
MKTGEGQEYREWQMTRGITARIVNVARAAQAIGKKFGAPPSLLIALYLAWTRLGTSQLERLEDDHNRGLGIDLWFLRDAILKMLLDAGGGLTLSVIRRRLSSLHLDAPLNQLAELIRTLQSDGYLDSTRSRIVELTAFGRERARSREAIGPECDLLWASLCSHAQPIGKIFHQAGKRSHSRRDVLEYARGPGYFEELGELIKAFNLTMWDAGRSVARRSPRKRARRTASGSSKVTAINRRARHAVNAGKQHEQVGL